tara:strand:+ start:1596 stop:1772 length:177 start_codon:yes stop_codon:yes gene_type:complete
METKPNRAERRAIKSKKPDNYVKARQAKKNDSQRQIRPLTTTPQIAAPIRATRYTGLT